MILISGKEFMAVVENIHGKTDTKIFSPVLD